MKKINLSISGCMGRMGQQLIKSSKINRNFKLVSLTENRLVKKKISGLKPLRNSIDAFKKSNVIIDFTVPKCTIEILEIACKLKKRVVIGTTGFTKKEENLIKKF
jgi:4-hydroxy-tetrahydrodipicolinate reductase